MGWMDGVCSLMLKRACLNGFRYRTLEMSMGDWMMLEKSSPLHCVYGLAAARCSLALQHGSRP